MTEANRSAEKQSMPAFPAREIRRDPTQASPGHPLPPIQVFHTGMSKREYVAAMALQGMLSSDMSTDRTKANKPAWAKAAVEFADELLKELAR